MRDRGYEKLMDGLMLPSSSSSAGVYSSTCCECRALALGRLLGAENQDPWMLPSCAFWLAVRNGWVWMVRPAGLCELAGRWTVLGSLGTGGTSTCRGVGLRPPGEGLRNVRSVMEPVLGDLRRSVERLWGRPRLAVDETEALRRMDRFDWASATFVGVVGRALRAAAAAADDNDVDDSRRMNADAAAVAAFGFAVSFVRGCWSRR